MRNKFFIVLLLLILLAAFFFIWKTVSKNTLSYTQQKEAHVPALTEHSPYPTTVVIDGQKISVMLALSEAEKEKGLGGVMSLPEDSGMIFKFDHPDTYGFWMKDTFIPLDMIWIDANMNIVYIAHDVLPESYPKVYKPDSPALLVLEVGAGIAEKYNWKIGDLVVVDPENSLQ